MRRQITALAAAAAMLGFGASTAHADWIATWAASPVAPGPSLGPPGGQTSFNNQTIKQTVRVSAGGRRVRVRFTNAGAKALTVGGASVGLGDGPPTALTFSGQRSAIVPPGAPLLSDPVDLAVQPLSKLSIRLFLPEDTGGCTCHNPAVDVGAVGAGDQTAGAFTPQNDFRLRAFLSGVDVDTMPSAQTIVTFGDSITDGVGASPDHRWPDLLADRLAKRGGHDWGVANEGISGNRVLDDGAGQSALARFDRDVLAVPGARYVIMFEGINDIGISYGHFEGRMAQIFQSMAPAHKATAERLIAGYRQIIARAHEHGLKVIGATITPYEGAAYYAPEGEAVREAVNDWIRKGGAFDGVIDFDKAVRDPAHPTQILAGLHAGDHLHGSDAGYKVMADSIDLSLFK